MRLRQEFLERQDEFLEFRKRSMDKQNDFYRRLIDDNNDYGLSHDDDISLDHVVCVETRRLRISWDVLTSPRKRGIVLINIINDTITAATASATLGSTQFV